MKRATWMVAIVAVLCGLGGKAARADDLSFTAGIDVAAPCNDVWTNLTEFPRLQKLVPHLHGTANVARANQIGDMLFYTIDKAGGEKSTGKFVVTSLEPAYKLQVMVQPDEGPWLRVQEFTLYQKPGAKGEKAKASACHVDYEESFNQLALKYSGYDASGIVKNLREPYMAIVLRRLKNLAEGKEAGPGDEVKKLAEVAKNFP
jgi:hypothetical protein